MQIINIFYCCRVTFQDGVLGLAVAILHHIRSRSEFRQKVTNSGGDRLHMREVSHGRGIIKSEFLASPHFLSGPAKVKRLEMKSENDIRAHTADHLAKVIIHPAYDG